MALARAVDYRSAGTVEFIVDRQRNFYFLEMNTRLQVEHPVTELVTGLDLVELMLRIAAGEKLPFAQEDIRLNGWAIEARIYAEDPTRGFLPSTGRLVRYLPPSGEGLRLDDGVFEGAEISVYYDPMIAKLSAYGADRDAAIDRLRAALDGFYISGVQNNAAFLAAIAAKPRFRAGALSTNFIAEEFPGGFAPPADFVEPDRMILLAAALAGRRIREGETAIDGKLAGGAAKSRAMDDPARRHAALGVGAARGQRLRGRVRRDAPDRDEPIGSRAKSCCMSGSRRTSRPCRSNGCRVRSFASCMAASSAGRRCCRRAPPSFSALMPRRKAADTSRLLLSPMPGLLSSVAVAPGQEVKAGEALAIVEAMKMENVLRADRDGRIAKIRAKPGDSLAVDEVILEFE